MQTDLYTFPSAQRNARLEKTSLGKNGAMAPRRSSVSMKTWTASACLISVASACPTSADAWSRSRSKLCDYHKQPVSKKSPRKSSCGGE